MQNVITILHWLDAHQLYAWIGLSIIINFALRARSPEQWIAWCDGYPRAASVIRLLRALGVDPVQAIEAVRAIVTGKARVDPFAVLPDSPVVRSAVAVSKAQSADELADEVLRRLEGKVVVAKVPDTSAESIMRSLRQTSDDTPTITLDMDTDPAPTP